MSGRETIGEPAGKESNAVIAALDHGVALEGLLTRSLGGLLPEQPDEAAFVASLERVLDVGCGTGTWAAALAEAYPHVDVFGFDRDAAKITCALRLANEHGLDRVHFRVMDALDALEYEDQFFDLVSARSVSLRTCDWPRALARLFRVTRAGGFIRFMETEDVGVTTSDAFEKLSAIFLQACRRRMISFSPTGRSMGVVPRFPRLLRDAGFVEIQQCAAALDWSAGTGAHARMADEMLSAFRRVRTFMTDIGVTDNRELNELYRAADVEVRADGFSALWTFYTVWGRRPAV